MTTVTPARFILYVVRTSPTPDRCEGAVPWRVDASQIFFGPCKKALRRALRERYLGPDRQLARVKGRERVVVAGVNAAQGPTPRKIVWAGELEQVMSFAEAWARLAGPRYERLRSFSHTPLHLEPIRDAGRLVGYRHHGLEHSEENAWWDDLVPPRMRARRVSEASPSVLRLAVSREWWDGFPLDACLLLENRFWADGAGLELDDEVLALLRAAQPAASGVEGSAPFGRNGKGQAIGKRGSYLDVGGTIGAKLVGWLDRRAPARSAEVGVQAGPAPRMRRC
jgi:hypothetical protein